MRSRLPRLRPNPPPATLIALGLAMQTIFLAAVLGPFSLLAHGEHLTDLTKLTASVPSLDLLVTLALVGLFVLYFAALGVAAAERSPPTAYVLGFTSLFSLTLIFLYPVTAMDVYNYAVQGHVLAFDHLNPLVDPPSFAPRDGFIAYAGSWANSPSPYGPAWLLLSRWTALLAGWDVIRAVLILKAVAALAVIATTALIATGGPRDNGRFARVAATLFGWNPLVQLELVGNGHNDAVMTGLLVVALVLLGVRRPAMGAVALAFSAMVKYLTLEALPLFLLALLVEPRSALRARVGTAATSALSFGWTAAMLFAPFWLGPITLDRVRAADSNYLSSISALAILIRPSIVDWLAYPRFVILTAVFLWQSYRLAVGRLSVAGAVFEIEFATILLANHFAGWYLPLLVALAALSNDTNRVLRAVVLTFTTTLTTPLWAFVWPAHQPFLDLLTFHLVIVPLTFLPTLLVGILPTVRKTARVAGFPRVLRRETQTP